MAKEMMRRPNRSHKVKNKTPKRPKINGRVVAAMVGAGEVVVGVVAIGEEVEVEVANRTIKRKGFVVSVVRRTIILQ